MLPAVCVSRIYPVGRLDALVHYDAVHLAMLTNAVLLGHEYEFLWGFHFIQEGCSEFFLVPDPDPRDKAYSEKYLMRPSNPLGGNQDVMPSLAIVSVCGRSGVIQTSRTL